MKPNRIWVVEMLCHSGYEPTVGVALNKEYAGEELKKWKMNSAGRFRIHPYVPEEEK